MINASKCSHMITYLSTAYLLYIGMMSLRKKGRMNEVDMQQQKVSCKKSLSEKLCVLLYDSWMCTSPQDEIAVLSLNTYEVWILCHW